MRTPARCAAAVALAAWASGARPADAKLGLSSHVVDVTFEAFEPGGSYSLRTLRGAPYAVKNRGDSPVDVTLAASAPGRTTPPYEPVPDASWLDVSPRLLRLAPGEVGVSDVVIRIPDDPSLAGRHFQAVIRARTSGGGLVQAGVDTRVRFSVGPGPGGQARRPARPAPVALNYDLSPGTLYLAKARAGARYDGFEAEGRSLRLTNRGSEPLRVVVEPEPWSVRGLPLPPGSWTAPADLSWARFVPSPAVVPPGGAAEIRLVLDRAPAALAGKRAAFFIKVRLPDGTALSSPHRAFVSFLPAGAP